MRPGNQSNKRMRGRGRKGPNPLTRTYESNGPDVKIRGTAMHVAEKYQQLARDAQASGDRIMSENYYQHAEHYLRIVAAAQPQQAPAAQPVMRAEPDEAAEAAGTAPNDPATNGAEPVGADRADGDAAVVDSDSPQPFIDNMPVIDPEGQVNGAAQSAAEAAQADEKPRRRTRTPRTRTPRKTAADMPADEAGEATAAGSDGDAIASGDGEEQPKPRRRTTRTRRPKAAEDVPAESVAASE